MTQQEIVGGSSAVRRIILVLTVAAVMAAMMLTMASPAFAKGPKFGSCLAREQHVFETGHGRVPPSCPFM
jgi:hypothetical protein